MQAGDKVKFNWDKLSALLTEIGSAPETWLCYRRRQAHGGVIQDIVEYGALEGDAILAFPECPGDTGCVIGLEFLLPWEE